MIVEYHLDQGLDQLGNPEEFTFDAWLLLRGVETLHLNSDGLPTVGSEVHPGLLLIGRFGATKSYSKEALPDDLEHYSTDEDTLISRYKHMFYDASLYVPEGICGKVTDAYLEPHGRYKRAVVRVEVTPAPGK